MANVINKTMVAHYLAELRKDEDTINEAGSAFESAKAKLDMALRRYTALRDYVSEQIGQSPYAMGVEWPEDDRLRWDDDVEPVRGRFRFAGLKVGDAITEVLRERDAHPVEVKGNYNEHWFNNTMSLDELVEVLSDGGLGFPEPVGARAINAALQALIKPGIVKRDGDGRYYYDRDYKPEPTSSVLAELMRTMQPSNQNSLVSPTERGGYKPASDTEVDDLPFE